MVIDYVKIKVKAGNGGNGIVSFRREKYVANGGPDGGDGGRGGNVILKVDPSVNTLLDFRYKKEFKAQDGKNGEGARRSGKSGQDLYISVPKGTIVKDIDKGSIHNSKRWKRWKRKSTFCNPNKTSTKLCRSW